METTAREPQRLTVEEYERSIFEIENATGREPDFTQQLFQTVDSEPPHSTKQEYEKEYGADCNFLGINDAHKVMLSTFACHLKDYYNANEKLFDDTQKLTVKQSEKEVKELIHKEDFVSLKAANDLLRKIETEMKMIENKITIPIAQKGRTKDYEREKQVVDYALDILNSGGKINIRDISKTLNIPYSACRRAIMKHNEQTAIEGIVLTLN